MIDPGSKYFGSLITETSTAWDIIYPELKNYGSLITKVVLYDSNN